MLFWATKKYHLILSKKAKLFLQWFISSIDLICGAVFMAFFGLLGFVFVGMAWIYQISVLDMSSFMNIALPFLFAFVLVFATSAFIASLMRLPNLPSYLLSLYLLSFANIVFASEIAGTLNLLGMKSRFFFLIIHLIFVVLAGFIWWRNNRPPLLEPISKVYFNYNLTDIRRSIKKYPHLWLLTAAVWAFYMFGAYLILYVPPNNYDGLTSHMTRIGYWLQHGNFLPWPTWDYTQQVYPLNAQLLMMWTILFWGWDQLAGFPQWLSALSGIIVIFGIARLLGWPRPQSIFAALIWSLLPEILLQSTTVQNHLIVGVLFACALYFLFLGVQSGVTAALILSGLALALALGTHQLAFFTLPGVLSIVCMIWLKYRRNALKPLLIWGVASLVAFLLVGSYMYIMNFSLYGDFFSQQTGTQVAVTSNNLASGANDGLHMSFLDGVILNVSRYTYDAFDLTGLFPGLFDPHQTYPLYRFRAQIASYVFEKLKISVEGNGFVLRDIPIFLSSEDVAWFGIIGFFLFPLLLLMQTVEGIKVRDPFRLGIFITAIAYITAWSGLIIGPSGSWSPYQGRYFVIMAVIVSPFLAAVFKPERFFRISSWVLIILSISIAYYTTINNLAKPLVGTRAIWTLGRAERQDVSGLFHAGFKKIDEFVPSNATLGLALGTTGFYQYPFFGKGFTRTLVPIYPDTKLADADWVSEKEVDWIFLCKPLPLPQGFMEISRFPMYVGECQLLKKTP
jgi:hypothetical protein